MGRLPIQHLRISLIANKKELGLNPNQIGIRSSYQVFLFFFRFGHSLISFQFECQILVVI